MGFHYHADGHAFNGNGINLYNSGDYVGRTHPPLIAFVFDGIAIYGTYGDDQSTMDGASEDLDDYGGHDHDDYGYHHHAFSEEVEQQNGPNTYTFTQNFLQRGAFKGRINEIPGFLNNNTNQFMDNDLKQYVGGSGTSQLFIKTGKNYLPNQITVSKSYPNPFNPTTKIRYNLENNESVNINIIDIKGNHIKQLIDSDEPAGQHSVQWDATNDLGHSVSAGVYFFTIETESEHQTRKMVLLK
jgi:flagellar hook assembly protein FlgD